MTVAAPDIDAFQLKTWEERGGEYVRRLVHDLRLTPEQAAGIVGNLGFKSAGFKTLQEIAPLAGGAGGFGVAQWTGPRRVAFMSWCNANKLDPASDQANYGYLVAELVTTQAATITALKRQASLQGAVFSVGQTYERPYGTTSTILPGYDGRLEYGQRALNGAQAMASPKPAGPLVSPMQGTSAPTPVLDALRALRAAVQAGGTDGAKQLQTAVGVQPVDGFIGKITGAALALYLSTVG